MKNKLYISIILVVAILVIANLISQNFFFRLDFSENKQYTLSNATKDLLKNLPEPVTVKAYFSADLPTNVEQIKKDFKEMLIEFNNRSKGMLVYEFINPGEKESIEQEAVQSGIQPVMINVRQKDQEKQVKAYLGVVISMSERKEVIPLIQSSNALEYQLSKAIKKLSVKDKPVISLLQGNGEPTIQEILQVYNELSVLYNIEPLTFTDTTVIPEKVKTMVIIKPKDTIPAKYLNKLDDFLSRGGRILIAYSRVNADLQKAYGASVSTGLENWLKSKGITISDNVVVDASCSQIQVVQQQAGYKMVSNMQFPYIPIVKSFAKHPISGSLEAIILPFASSIEYNGSSSNIFTPIAFSSDKSGVELLPVSFNIQRQWNETDFSKKNLVLAATLEGKLAGNAESKIVVIGNGDFIINGNQNQAQQVNPDNINFMANSIDWLSDDTGLIGLRTKTVTARPIDNLSDATRATLKWLNFLLPIILVLAYGFIRVQINRNKRIKRMEESYV
jgi:gliding-associated putative ABC transporter substrate-binding component GldG